MSSIADKVFDQLMAGKSPTEVRAAHGSASKFAAGLQKYLSWGVPEATSLRSEIASLKSAEKKLTESIENLQADQEKRTKAIDSLTIEQGTLSKQINEKSSSLQQIQSQTKQTEEKLQSLKSEIQKLEAKGYTSELMLKLSRSDATSGSEMLQRVQTVETNREEILKQQKTQESLKKENEDALNERKDLKTKVETARVELNEINGRLSKRRDEERFFEASTNVVKSLMQNYRLESRDFETMYSFFKKIGTPGMPGRTMDNVKTTIEYYHTLKGLEAAINGRKEALDKIDAELGKTEAQLEASTKAFTGVSEKIEQLFTKIQNTAKTVELNVQSSLGKLQTSSDASLKQVTEKARGEIGTAKDEALKSLTSIHDKNKTHLEDLAGQCGDTLKKIQNMNEEAKNLNKAQLDEWKKTQTQIVKETQESINSIRDQAAKAGKTLGNLEALAPTLKVLTADGKPSEIYSAMSFICQQFNSWLLKNSPSSSSIKDHLKYLVEDIVKEVVK